jgi:hypothetical protein
MGFSRGTARGAGVELEAPLLEQTRQVCYACKLRLSLHLYHRGYVETQCPCKQVVAKSQAHHAAQSSPSSTL